MHYQNMTTIYLASTVGKLKGDAPNIVVDDTLVESAEFKALFGDLYIDNQEGFFWSSLKYVLFDNCSEAGLEKFDISTPEDKSWFRSQF